MPGTLTIVATPIGNLEDITLRALRVLKEADAVVAEDSRRTLPLLTHYGIRKPVISYFEFSKKSRGEEIIRRLMEGENLAMVCDAGTPTLSDPGARLISMAYEKGISVIPVPGSSAVLAALSVAGFPTEPFHFWGFLSPSLGKRKKVYHSILSLSGTHGFFESPHKLLKHLKEWEENFADFFLFVGREMTKKFETYHRGPFQQIALRLANEEPRGEYTILLAKELL